jgi:Heterokaryon incompatibility protein (HET)
MPESANDKSALIFVVEILHSSSADRIRCNLRKIPFHEANYVAISYQWGSLEESNMKEIELNSKPFYVTSNLHAFLTAAQQKGVTESLWIDAISIDQKSIALRNEEVKRMGEIYSSAKDVWVWLGEVHLESTMSSTELFDLSQPEHLKDLSHRARLKIDRWRNTMNNDWFEALLAISNQNYWSRLWIVQEFVKAQSLHIWINNGIVSGDHLSNLIVESTNTHYLYPDKANREKVRKSNAWKLCKTRVDNNRESSGSNSLLLPIDRTLLKFSGQECSDWHDKIYGLLGLTVNGDQFKVDYASNKIGLMLATVEFYCDNPETPRGDALVEFVHQVAKELNLTGNELLKYRPLDVVKNRDLAWKILPLQLFGLVHSRSHFGPFVLNKDVLSKRGTSFTLKTCRCRHCWLLPSLKAGDEVYWLTVGRGIQDAQSFFALRRSSVTRSGIAFVGALTVNDAEKTFTYHSLPKLDSHYNMGERIHRDPVDETLLQVRIDPQTLGFLLRGLKRTVYENVTVVGNSGLYSASDFSWDHDLGPIRFMYERFNEGTSTT